MWDVWWTKRHMERFISFHPFSIFEKMIKLIIFLFIFITGLHNNPQGCGASVASAAGPFSK
jgi:hypothetical protein